MIRLFLLLAVFSVQYTQAQTVVTKRQEVASKINHVLAFVSGAQITRKATASLTAGKTELVFTDISPNIDKQSIQVKGEGSFTILSVIHQMNHLKEQTRREEITKLETQKRALQKRFTNEQSMLTVYKQEEVMLLKNQAIGGQNVGVKTADLREAVDFQRTRLAEALLKQREIEQTLAQLDSATHKIDAQMTALNRKQNLSTSEVLVTISTKEPLNAKFEISYLVKDAGWYATYDLRVQDITKPIDLAFKANIRQSSGEDWRDVKLSISNGNPTEGGTAPTLTAWLLRYGAPYATNSQATGDKNAVVGEVYDSETGEPLLGASIMLKGTTIGTSTDGNGFFKLNTFPVGQILVASMVGYISKEIMVSSNQLSFELSSASVNLQEVVITGYNNKIEKKDKEKYKQRAKRGAMTKDVDKEEDGALRDRLQGAVGGVKITEKSDLGTVELAVDTKFQTTTVVFDIEMPYTVLNDGKVYTAEIKNHSLPATYQYYAVPKLDKDAFLTAQITNWQDLNLMEGELNLFFEGAFLGKSVLDLRKASDTLEISLGRDKGIVIERKNLKEYTSKQLLSNYKTENRAYQITVKNNKNAPIKLILQDHFPTSPNKDITIDNKEAKDAEIDNKTNIITWKLDIAPRTEKVQTFKYSVKYPKRETLILD
jgi:hypothetical protein